MTTTTRTGFDGLRATVQESLLGETDEHIARLTWSAGKIRAHQRDQLRALLAHAGAHSPFHRRRLAGVDPRSFELANLAALPVMTKAEMMAELDDVFTDPRLTSTIVDEALAATQSEPVAMFDEYFAMTSGGSSGQRGVFVLDRRAAVAFFSSLSRGLLARLRALGGPPPGGLTIGMVSAASAVHATGSAPAWTSAPDMPFRFLPVPVTLPLGEIVARLEAMQPMTLYGYPSMLARLAAEQQAGRLHLTPFAVTSTSEMLLPEHRAAIREAFGAPIVNTFGSTEGLVGATAPDEDVFVFNSDRCIVELVDDDNRPVPPGTPSSKVLVTNLANHTQPLIRYELTDRFTEQPTTGEHGHLRATVEGRSDDVLRYGAVTVHPLVIRSAMLKAGAAEYQVRQTERGVAIAVVAVDAFDADALRADVARALDGAGLRGPDVSVERVTAIDRNPHTGKFRLFVPLA